MLQHRGTLLVLVASAVAALALAGAGQSAIGFFAVSPVTTSVDFGSVPVGSESAPVTTVIRNTGTLAIPFSEATGEFEVGSTGGTCFTFTSLNKLPIGATCTVNFLVTPQKPGLSTGFLVAAFGNCSCVTAAIPWQVNGLVATTTVTPAALSFGGVAVGGASPPQTVTFTNTGVLPAWTGFPLFFPFPSQYVVVADTCTGVLLAIGATCTIKVSFHPTALGPAASTLTVDTGMYDTPPAVIALSGTGIFPPSFSIDRTSLSFLVPLGNVDVQTVTIGNGGGGSIALGAVSITGQGLSIAGNDCPASLAAGAGCHIQVAFSPFDYYTGVSGSLTISHDAPGGPAVVALSAHGSEASAAGGGYAYNLGATVERFEFALRAPKAGVVKGKQLTYRFIDPLLGSVVFRSTTVSSLLLDQADQRWATFAGSGTLSLVTPGGEVLLPGTATFTARVKDGGGTGSPVSGAGLDRITVTVAAPALAVPHSLGGVGAEVPIAYGNIGVEGLTA